MTPRVGSRVVFACLALLLVAAGPLDGTGMWDMPPDPAKAMVEGLHRYLDRATSASVASRDADWQRLRTRPDWRDTQRRRLEAILGATGERVKPVRLAYVSGPDTPAPLAINASIRVTAVTWTVYPGVEAEGLLVEPVGEVIMVAVAVPDATGSPERFVWGEEGESPEVLVAKRMAALGCRILVPTLIDRTDEFSGSPLVRSTNLSHREWVYRMAYEAGRHVIGYEVDKVRAAVDWLSREGEPKRRVGVMGYGEGGRIALYAAALDPRVDVAWVAGAFGTREAAWSEPIDRNVWGGLLEFGDAEVARLILPRDVIVETCLGPNVAGPNPPRGGRSDAASGTLAGPSIDSSDGEFARLRNSIVGIPRGRTVEYIDFPYSNVGSDAHPGPILKRGASPKIDGQADMNRKRGNSPRLDYWGYALRRFLPFEGLGPASFRDDSLPKDPRPTGSSRDRMARQVRQLVEYTQALIRTSELRRDAYWSKADATSVDAWEASTGPYRDTFWTGLIGKLPAATGPLAVRTKQVYDEPRWAGYAVQIPVYPDVVASGVLLLPKDLKPGERRPVVVCQHGLEGTPEPVVDPRVKSVYHSFGARLADRGYIVYAPQNPYIGQDRFRQLQRKANPLGLSIFSFIVRQHERTLEWLKTRPEVDGGRIAFYGLSYGGKTAMRVPAILKDYCLSICSADFNEWAVKCTNIDRKYSYMFTIEYDMYEFGLAERFNYAEMAALIAPRPFLVERGHDDGVAPDEWVGYEFAKVRRTYDRLGVGNRAELAVFNGGHQIDGRASFAFLAKHLRWPRGAEAPAP